MTKKERTRRKHLVKQASDIVSEFYKNAKPTTFFENMRKKFIEEFNSEEWREKEYKRQQGVAEIMNHIVGF